MVVKVKKLHLKDFQQKEAPALKSIATFVLGLLPVRDQDLFPGDSGPL